MAMRRACVQGPTTTVRTCIVNRPRQLFRQTQLWECPSLEKAAGPHPRDTVRGSHLGQRIVMNGPGQRGRHTNGMSASSVPQPRSPARAPPPHMFGVVWAGWLGAKLAPALQHRVGRAGATAVTRGQPAHQSCSCWLPSMHRCVSSMMCVTMCVTQWWCLLFICASRAASHRILVPSSP